jgi:hypothetical protein
MFTGDSRRYDWEVREETHDAREGGAPSGDGCRVFCRGNAAVWSGYLIDIAKLAL